MPDSGDIVDTGLAEAGTGVQIDAACSDASSTQPSPVLLPAGSACGATIEPIAAWSLGGTATTQYQSGFDSTMTCNGGPSLHLASSTATGSAFGEVGNGKMPGAWLGQRVRLSAWVMSSGVTGWAGLWMRVDSATQNAIAFDNMQCRAISGSTGWSQYQVVLDVAPDASLVAYGILLSDQGEVWIDGVALDVVDDCVPTTGCL